MFTDGTQVVVRSQIPFMRLDEHQAQTVASALEALNRVAVPDSAPRANDVGDDPGAGSSRSDENGGKEKKLPPRVSQRSRLIMSYP